MKGLTLDALDASDFKLEQFTGLTDVNGKDIYEGDILRLSRNEPKTYIYDDKDNLKPKIIMPKTVTQTAPVINDTGTFGVNIYKVVFLTLREVDKGQQSIEVIGNVHENAELLEAEK
ncbi:prophage Lp1 protein 30 [Lactiplantibacillus plantarum]|nr:prophage Lp1 protein 30 [Lactiplantibacillus plantarum]KZU42689.1 prophage Lp1 protein 30 [Lactiplantibacillus plantarum]